MRIIIITALLFLILVDGVASAAKEVNTIEIEAEGSYQMGAVSSIDLAKKYPNWDSIYMAKAITHYILNEPGFMETALNAACRLGNNTACSDLKNLKKVHEYDFGISIID